MWPHRTELIPGQHNVISAALVPRENIFLSSMHIKLGLAKQFLKELDSASPALQYIQQTFLNLSEAKIVGGIFTGPQIRFMLNSNELKQNMTDLERNAWEAFHNLVTGFLVHNRSDALDDQVKTLIESTGLQNVCKITHASFAS